MLQVGGDALALVPGVGVSVGLAKNGDVLAEGIRGYPKIVDIVSRVAHEPGFVSKKVEQYMPNVGAQFERVGLLEPGASAISGAPADMVNFLNKTVGAGKKTVGVVVDAVNGSDD